MNRLDRQPEIGTRTERHRWIYFLVAFAFGWMTLAFLSQLDRATQAGTHSKAQGSHQKSPSVSELDEKAESPGVVPRELFSGAFVRARNIVPDFSREVRRIAAASLLPGSTTLVTLRIRLQI